MGIRDIADEANVNSAMISYYFGGKAGLLREIFMRFDRLLSNESAKSLKAAQSQDELIRLFVGNVLDNAREHLDIYLVGLKEMNHDSEELQDLREEFHAKSEATFLANVERLGIHLPENPAIRSLGFTTGLGLIFSDYLLGGCACVGDESLVEAYKETVTSILATGMTGYWS